MISSDFEKPVVKTETDGIAEPEIYNDSESLELEDIAGSVKNLINEVEAEEGNNDDYRDNEYCDNGYYDEIVYGNERVEFDERNMKIRSINIPKEIIGRHEFLKELPSGVVVMGGFARSVAREILTGDREPIRDIDLVNITTKDGESKNSEDTLDVLSEKFMPDDYAFGHGIQNDTLENYFNTRDFTINQTLVMDGKLIISDFAENDLINNIIRPTYYELPDRDEDLSSRLYMKSLMMKTVLGTISQNKKPELADIWIDDSNIYPFDIALNLNKAMGRGAETAVGFVNELVEQKILSEDFLEKPKETATYLRGQTYSFNFRPAIDKNFIDIYGQEDLDAFFIPTMMSRFYTSDPKIKAAIAEYEDDVYDNLKEYEGRERKYGHYTQSEYDEINRYFDRKKFD